MIRVLSVMPLVASLLFSAGCVHVADVEGRLQNLRFHPNMYVVQAGDTLESVAYRYELSTEQLLALNVRARRDLLPGDRLNVRPGTSLSNDVRNRTGGGWYKEPAGSKKRVTGSSRASDRARRTRSDEYVVVEPTIAAAAPVEEVIEEVVIAQAPLSRAGGAAGVREEYINDDYVEEPVVRTRVPVQSSSTMGPGLWQWPAEGELAREYAPNEVNGQGIDIAGVPGQDIRSAADGTVVYTGRDLSNSGLLVIVRHSDNLLSTYSHAKDLYVAEEDYVKAGDPIASLGWNADRESVLHFEIRKDGKPVDPAAYLPAR